MALARVQGTGRKTASGAAAIAITFASPPTVGNAVLVEVICYAATFTGCTDNRGHTYTQAVTQTTGVNNAVIYYLPIVATSAAPFTITVTTGTAGYFEAAAIEISGVGTGLVIDQTQAAAGSSTTVTTGASAAVTASEVVVAAVHSCSANQASITVQVLSPAWTEEFENLNYSATIAGEGDTRIVPSAAGTTQTATWTITNSIPYAAVLAAFAAPGGAAAVATANSYVWGPV